MISIIIPALNEAATITDVIMIQAAARSPLPTTATAVQPDRGAVAVEH